ncbi:MAG: hypothetical protein H6652_02070 [Ardenticatenaceae bacterium]|nr:hypothetical protein [Ardenticatenaceae bacterium]
MKRFLIFLLLPLFLLACDSTGNENGDLVPYSSENYPITFLKPENWAISDDADSISIATEADLLTANSIKGGARINIVVTPALFMGSGMATEMVDAAVRSFRDQAETDIIQETAATTIDTQSAVQTVLRGPDAQGNEIIFRYVVIENLTVGQTAVVAAVHDAKLNNEYGQLMADIVNSIQLGEETP